MNMLKTSGGERTLFVAPLPGGVVGVTPAPGRCLGLCCPRPYRPFGSLAKLE